MCLCVCVCVRVCVCGVRACLRECACVVCVLDCELVTVYLIFRSVCSCPATAARLCVKTTPRSFFRTQTTRSVCVCVCVCVVLGYEHVCVCVCVLFWAMVSQYRMYTVCVCLSRATYLPTRAIARSHTFLTMFIFFSYGGGIV